MSHHPLGIAAAILILASFAEAGRADDKDMAAAFPKGSKAAIQIVDDEAQQLPGLAKAGAVSADSIVLVASEQLGDWEIAEAYRKVVNAYRRAVDAGDPEALTRLIEQGQAFRVSEGTLVVVRNSWPLTTQWRTGLPSDPGGIRRVVILDGPSKGKVGEVPARNLKPVPLPLTPEEAKFLPEPEPPDLPDDKRDRPPIRYEAEEGRPKDRAARKRRDYAVLEACLNDIAEFRDAWNEDREPADRKEQIVLNLTTKRSSVAIDPGGEDIPDDIREDFGRRSVQSTRSLSDFRPATPNVVLRNLGREFARTRTDPNAYFHEKYPTALIFLFAYPPGYSKDGKTAVAILEVGPTEDEPATVTYLLTREGKRWRVEWVEREMGGY